MTITINYIPEGITVDRLFNEIAELITGIAEDYKDKFLTDFPANTTYGGSMIDITITQ